MKTSLFIKSIVLSLLLIALVFKFILAYYQNFISYNYFAYKIVYESSEKIILVMEYASGGELYDYLNERKRIPESEARGIFRQIVSAVHFLHKNRIVHRDLKLENILIDHNGDIKVCKYFFYFSIKLTIQ